MILPSPGGSKPWIWKVSNCPSPMLHPGLKKYGLTFPQTNIAPGNGWLEYYLPFGMAYSIFGCYVSFREGISSIKMYQTTTFLVSKWKCIQKWISSLKLTDIAPENGGPLEKGIPIGNHHFDVLCLFWGVYGIIQGQWWLIIFDHTLPPIIMVQSKIGVSPSRFTLPWMFLKIGVPQNGWFRMENPFWMDDVGVPLFFRNTHMGERVINYSWKNCGLFLGVTTSIFRFCQMPTTLTPQLLYTPPPLTGSFIHHRTHRWMDGCSDFVERHGKSHAELEFFAAKNDQIDETWSGEWYMPFQVFLYHWWIKIIDYLRDANDT